MSLIVQKYGGTSVKDISKIKKACLLISAEKNRGNDVVVIASAMAGYTNKMVKLAENFSKCFIPEEYDTVVSSGEQISVGLISMCLNGMGIKARSLLGWQIPIVSDENHSKAKIIRIEKKSILKLIKENTIPVIAGFQGINPYNNRITTMGRGGSDTSAVAIAATIKADRCDIYTDVDGVYTSDPRIVKNAKKIDRISYEEMLEFASLGAKVLQTRSVEMAMRHNVKVQVLSSTSGKPGTTLVKEEKIMEKALVSGITHSKEECNITLINLQDKPGIAAKIFTPLSQANINVDMIVQTGSENRKHINFTFSLSKTDLKSALEQMNANKKVIGFQRIITNKKLARISIVGLGMKTHSGVAEKMFSILASKKINIHVISTSEIKISVLIDEKSTEAAVRALHTGFILG